jgi:hypothetical protein
LLHREKQDGIRQLRSRSWTERLEYAQPFQAAEYERTRKIIWSGAKHSGGHENHYTAIAVLIDKLMDIKSGKAGASSAGLNASPDEPSAADKAAHKAVFEELKRNEDASRRAAIPADKRDWFDSLAGGNTWVLEDKPPADVAGDIEAIREQMVADIGHADNAFYRGIKQALRDGSMKIVPTAEVPDFGYATFSMNIYNNDGYVQGGAGTGTGDLDYVRAQREQGVHVSAFSLNGNDYVLIWNVSAEEKEKGSWAP